MILLIGFLILLYVLFKCIVKKTDSIRQLYPCSVCVVLGSGGHTTELLRLLNALDINKFYPRRYIIANTDKYSIGKAQQFEASLSTVKSSYEILCIPRSREVGQSYLTSIFSTIKSILFCVPLVYRVDADLLLVNGPGTCIPICFLAWLYRLLRLKKCKIVYVESWCRVKKISLSAEILYYFRLADKVLVQWPELKQKYSRAEYIGRIL